MGTCDDRRSLWLCRGTDKRHAAIQAHLLPRRHREFIMLLRPIPFVQTCLIYANIANRIWTRWRMSGERCRSGTKDGRTCTLEFHRLTARIDATIIIHTHIHVFVVLLLYAPMLWATSSRASLKIRQASSSSFSVMLSAGMKRMTSKLEEEGKRDVSQRTTKRNKENTEAGLTSSC